MSVLLEIVGMGLVIALLMTLRIMLRPQPTAHGRGATDGEGAGCSAACGSARNDCPSELEKRTPVRRTSNASC